MSFESPILYLWLKCKKLKLKVIVVCFCRRKKRKLHLQSCVGSHVTTCILWIRRTASDDGIINYGATQNQFECKVHIRIIMLVLPLSNSVFSIEHFESRSSLQLGKRRWCTFDSIGFVFDSVALNSIFPVHIRQLLTTTYACEKITKTRI